MVIIPGRGQNLALETIKFVVQVDKRMSAYGLLIHVDWGDGRHYSNNEWKCLGGRGPK